MSNVTVTFTPANVTVDETNLSVNVSQTTSNIVVSNVASIGNSQVIRSQFSVTDTGGDGSLTYSNTTGVFTYTGPSASEVRAHLSNTSPIEYNSTTGVISIDSNAVFSGKTTDDLAEGSTNLYYTTARANAAILDYDGALTPSSLTATGNVEGVTLKATGALGLVVNGNATIGGNLDVTGNINSETVVDLFVEDRNITMQYGAVGAPSANSQIFIDRGDEANTYIKWDEANDAWKFSNDGSTEYAIPTSTSELAEGTNLYFTNARANAAFTDSLDNITSNITTTANVQASWFLGNVDASNIITQELLVEDDHITLNHGVLSSGSPANILNNNAVIYANALEDGNQYELNNSFDEANIDDPRGIAFNNTGTQFYVVESSDYTVYAYNVSTAYDLTTATPNNSKVFASGNTYHGIAWSNDGSNVFIGKSGAVDDISRYVASTPYDISSIGSVAGVMNATTSGGFVTSRGITFNNDGTKLFVAKPPAGASLTSIIQEYSMSTPYDISIANLDSAFDTSSQDDEPNGVVFNSTGSEMVVLGTENNKLYKYTLSTPFDVTTASFTSELDNVSKGAGTGPRMLTKGGDNQRLGGDLENLYVSYFPHLPAGTIDTYTLFTGKHLKWNNDSFEWQFNDGSNSYTLPRTTSDLTEGTNLYYTDARFDTRLATKDTDDLSEGSSNLYFTDSRSRAALSTTTASASGGGALAYDSGTGVFTFTPADLSAKIELTNLSVTTAAASGDGSLAYDNTSGVFTFTPADAGLSDYGDSNVVTLLSAFGSNTISSTANITTTANVSADTILTDKVESGASANLNLKGQADGIHFDTTIDSTESRIVDLDTTGYSIADVTTPADFTQGTNTPSAIVNINLTAGNATVTVNDIFGGALAGLGVQVAALRGPGFSTATGGASTGPILAPTTGGFANVLHAFTTAGTPLTFPAFGIDIEANGLANATAGLYGQDKGWSCFDLTTSSSTTLFPANAYVTGMTSGTITFSEPALITASPRTVVLGPGMAQTSDSKTTVKYYANTHTGSNSDFISNYGRLSSFDLPETLSNTTFDAISYGNTSSVTTTVTMKNISDFAGTDESATRFKRGLLIGAATTPDPASGRETLNQPSTLGVILESDGESFNDGLNTPAPRFLINNYSGGMDDLTNYPVWGQVGATGNLTLDLPQLKAPSLTLKSFRGAKSTANTTSYLMQAGDVVGKIAFSPAQTTGTGNQGVDAVNPPAAITVDVGSANINTGVANAYMHITTTPYSGTNLGYSRNNANADSGANQQTNFTTKDGNLTLAAQTSGKITLAPTPDYGDGANSTVWTRYPGSTHNFHTYLDASFGNISARTGTIIDIQPKSGTTDGGGGLAYDSVGDATLRLNVHESNSDIKQQWVITNEQSSGNLLIRDHTADQTVMHFNGDRVFIDESLRLQNLTTTEINAIASPQAGDVVYNTTLNQICFYNGTAWQKVTSATM